MTGRHRATRPAAGTATGTAGFDLLDEAGQRAEIDRDRRRERFLLRAVLVAAFLVAAVVTTRVVWL